jgi:hypothetical protein
MRPKSMPFSPDRSSTWLAVRVTAVLRGIKQMFGKNNSVDTLSRNLDQARVKRDALASDVTALTAQIAEIEARLSGGKKPARM